MGYVTVEELADALHTRVTAQNTDALQLAVDAASGECDAWLDRKADDPLPTPTPPVVRQVVLARAVEWFKAADAAFGIIGYADIGVMRAPRNGFARHAATLLPYKAQWGVA